MASNTEQLLPYLAVGDCIVYRHNLTQHVYCVVLCQKAKKEIPCFLQSLIQYVTLVGGEGLKEQRKFDDG